MAELRNIIDNWNENDSENNKFSSEVLIEMLDYDYIEQCDDLKLMKGIVSILQSGKEGSFPDLLKKAEDKLFLLLPKKEQEKLLRMKTQASPVEIRNAENDIFKWQNEITSLDKNMKSKLISNTRISNDRNKIPPVRGRGEIQVSFEDSSLNNMSDIQYSNTDLFHHNEELMKIEIFEEERIKLLEFEIESINEINSAKKRSKLFIQEVSKHWNNVKSELTSLQAKVNADREWRKGNEYYKAGENDKAYECYTKSIALFHKNSIVFANRAMSCLRLEKYDTAEDDCSRALQIDSLNIKALSRRGNARLKKGKYYLAAKDFRNATKLDPTNTAHLSLFEKSKTKYMEVEGKELIFSDIDKVNQSNEKKQYLEFIPFCVSNANSLYLPSIKAQLLEYKSCNESSCASSTRILIEESDNDQEIVTNVNANESITRIPITFEDEEDDKDEESVEIVEESIEIISDIMPVKTNAELALELKEEGNKLLTNKQAELAIEAYTKSLKLDSSLIASRSNRVVAFIATKRYHDAIKDADMIINSSNTMNLKTLLRRGNAYYLLVQNSSSNDHITLGKYILNACNDIRKVIQFDSSNHVANDLMKSIHSLISTRTHEWKETGNNEMKRLNFCKALESYNNALCYEPENMLIICNRSQTYLKLEDFVNAEKDATKVINCSNIDDGLLKKALYRRGLARRSLIESKFMKLAIDDFTKLLELDPMNKQTQLELTKTKQMLQETSLGKVKENNSISFKEIEELDMKPVQTIRKTILPLNKISVIESDNPPIESKAKQLSDEVISQTNFSSSPTSTLIKSKKIFSKQISISKEPPKTEYEFERIWRSLKNHPDLFISYLKSFKRETLKRVFKGSSISSDLLSSLLSTLNNCGDNELMFTILFGLSKVACFDMTLAVLPNEDEEILRSIFSHLHSSVNEKIKSNDVHSLEQMYFK